MKTIYQRNYHSDDFRTGAEFHDGKLVKAWTRSTSGDGAIYLSGDEFDRINAFLMEAYAAEIAAKERP